MRVTLTLFSPTLKSYNFQCANALRVQIISVHTVLFEVQRLLEEIQYPTSTSHGTHRLEYVYISSWLDAWLPPVFFGGLVYFYKVSLGLMMVH